MQRQQVDDQETPGFSSQDAMALSLSCALQPLPAASASSAADASEGRSMPVALLFSSLLFSALFLSSHRKVDLDCPLASEMLCASTTASQSCATKAI